MTPSRWPQVEKLFQEAIERTVEERRAFLKAVRDEDPELGDEVASLLKADAEGGVLDAGVSAFAPAAETGTGSLASGQKLGRYVVLEKLGAGGMGTVYAAYDPELDRRVALKLLHGRYGSRAETARIRREAQALARLDHQNVVGIYDVGLAGDRLFLALQYVDGENLAAWGRTRRRSWPEVVEVFRSAGGGVAAAHRAGLVHRDIKPENILIHRDGRVFVVDFGLARFSDSISTPGLGTEAAERRLLGTRITRSDALIGTPAYLAPEYLAGSPADAQSDQYSFAVTFWEALYGERPAYDPKPPEDANVPAWVRRVAERGLARDPTARHATMDALLEALERDPARRRRRAGLAAAVAAVLLTGAAALGLAYQAKEARCQKGRERIGMIWGAARREAVQSAFTAVDAPFAVAAWQGVLTQLDRYSQNWTAAFDEACAATHLRREQSAAVLDRRRACLDVRFQAMTAVIDLLERADTATVREAVTATHRLPPIAACADVPALLAAGVPPADPETRRAVDALRAELARAWALETVGRIDEALALAEDVVHRAGELGDAPLLAEAKLGSGRLLDLYGRNDASYERLLEALWTAEAARHDTVVAEAWIELVGNRGRTGRIEEARRLARHAAAAIGRLGGDEALEAWRLDALGRAEAAAGERSRARRALTDAIELQETIFDGAHPLLARSLDNLAGVELAGGEVGEAIVLYERSLALRKTLFGADHPEVTRTEKRIAEIRETQPRKNAPGNPP